MLRLKTGAFFYNYFYIRQLKKIIINTHNQ